MHFDKNGDGDISLAEFQAALKSLEQIFKETCKTLKMIKFQI